VIDTFLGNHWREPANYRACQDLRSEALASNVFKSSGDYSVRAAARAMPRPKPIRP